MKRHYAVLLLVSVIVLSPFTLNVGKAHGDHGNLLLSVLETAYGSRINESRYNANADLNNDGIVNLADLVLYCQVKTAPLILDVSTNLPQGSEIPNNGVILLNAIAEHANRCILSYMYEYHPNETDWANVTLSDWVNETMTGHGNFLFNGAIDTSSMPGNANQGPQTWVYYKITATNHFGFSNETATSSFALWSDP